MISYETRDLLICDYFFDLTSEYYSKSILNMTCIHSLSSIRTIPTFCNIAIIVFTYHHLVITANKWMWRNLTNHQTMVSQSLLSVICSSLLCFLWFIYWSVSMRVCHTVHTVQGDFICRVMFVQLNQNIVPFG